jgi:hypothetical protein
MPWWSKVREAGGIVNVACAHFVDVNSNVQSFTTRSTTARFVR